MGDMNMSARMCAFKILYKIECENAFSNIALKEGLCGSALCDADRRLVSTIVYGSVKYKKFLDYVISQFSSVKLKKLSTKVLLILRMGIYQIIKLERVPDSAAVNESVKLAGKLAYRSKGFVNALLRKVSQNKNEIKLPDDKIERLATLYSYPNELVKMWADEYGYDFTHSLLKCGNENAPFTIRVNTLKISEDELVELLKEEQVQASKTDIENILVLTGGDVSSLDSFREGLFSVQGIGSYFASMVLSPKSGDVVMDLCAAPGGKSTHMAEIMKNKGAIYSFDIHKHRVELIKNSAARLGIDIINAKAADSAVCMKQYVRSADAVLADVPCSGLGIIRKKPDIKWSFDISKTDELCTLQYNILCAGSEYVKDGGVLVYSTCTISKDENIGVVNKFLKEHKDFSLCPIENVLPEKYEKQSLKEGYIEFYPNIDGIDGFFICKMKRESK